MTKKNLKLKNELVNFEKQIIEYSKIFKTETETSKRVYISLVIIEFESFIFNMIFILITKKVEEKNFKEFLGAFYREKEKYNFTFSLKKIRNFIKILEEKAKMEIFKRCKTTRESDILSKAKKQFFKTINDAYEARNKCNHDNMMQTENLPSGFTDFGDVLATITKFLDSFSLVFGLKDKLELSIKDIQIN